MCMHMPQGIIVKVTLMVKVAVNEMDIEEPECNS